MKWNKLFACGTKYLLRKWAGPSSPSRTGAKSINSTTNTPFICFTSRDGKVLGYQRMLPSTRPHLLSEVMPELCEVERPVGPHIWECTRHCVAQGHREKGRFAAPIANALLSGMVEWGLESGISTAIIEIEPTLLLRLVQLAFPDVAARPAPKDWKAGLPCRHRHLRLADARTAARNARQPPPSPRRNPSRDPSSSMPEWTNCRVLQPPAAAFAAGPLPSGKHS